MRLTPEVAAAELRALEKKAGLRRRWVEDGAANVYFRGRYVLAFVGSDVLAKHRLRHRRHHRDECGKLCEARDLYACLLLCMARDLSWRVMPLRRLMIPLVERFLGGHIKLSESFHLNVWRDLRRLRDTVRRAKGSRSAGERSLIARYVSTATCLRATETAERGLPEKSARHAPTP